MTDAEFVAKAIDISDTLDSDFADWALDDLVEKYREEAT